MVEGYWHVNASLLFSGEQKTLLGARLINKINADGFLLVKSQVHRTQIANKQEVVLKMNLLVSKALIIPKKRKPTRPGKLAKQKRLDVKKKAGDIKVSRKKVSINE